MLEEELLLTALEAAADADVAIVGAGSVVAFTHPLLASAIYDAATPGERRRAHRVLAQALEDPVERARHRSKLITVPDEDVAAELDRAAEISRERGAQQLVGELLERAARATPEDVDTAVGLGRWLRAADSYVDAGDNVAAQAALDRGSSLAVLPHQRGEVLVRRARLAVDIRRARVLAEQAFRLAPAGGEARAKILLVLGECHRGEGRGALAVRFAQIAVTAAAAVGCMDLQLAALNLRQAVEQLWGLGRPQQTLRDVDRLIDERLAASTGALPIRQWVTEWAFMHGFFAAWNDETAEKHVRDGIARAVDAGRYGDLSSLYICLIMVLIRSSRVREAQAALDEADRSGAWTGFGLQEAMARILVMEYSGDLDGARALASDAVARSGADGEIYWQVGFLAQLGYVETSARNWQAALEPLREVADIIARTKIVDLEQLLWAVDYADAALQVGALDEVQAAIGVLRSQGAAARPEASVAADRCQALLTAARGDTDTAVRELRAIVDRPEAECPFEAARSRLALGQVYRRAGYKAMAAETLASAANAFEELGVPCWAERARQEAGRVGRHPTASALTATERRVAELVGSGHSNQETAAELFMSVKTVEANLTRIYRKLSVRSRTELANQMNSADSATPSRN
jgi:DNA-binding CsgD family transcriptional regulator